MPAGSANGCPVFSVPICHKLRLNKKEIPGNDLLSHIVANAVPSARAGLTAVFGMGTGVSPSLWSPDISFVTKEIVKVCARI
jgi:hypothetical protein